jgi:putative transposase
MISFKGTHFPKDVILYAVFFYVRYGVSYRDLEEIMEERGVNVDHATLNRWVIRYAPAIAAKAHSQKRNTNRSWRMDETYIKVKGKCVYLYRAVDSHGDTKEMRQGTNGNAIFTDWDLNSVMNYCNPKYNATERYWSV